MKRTIFGTLTAALLLVLSAGSIRADSITVDGSWSDWGINPSSGDWSASTGTRIFYENYTGTDGTAYLEPGWGGQFFDAEAIYATWSGNSLYFAIVTGFDPDGVKWGSTLYTPGDIFVNTGDGWKVGIDLQTGNVYTNATHSTPGFASSGPFTITGGTLVGSTNLYVPFDGVITSYHSGDTTSKHYLFEGSLDLGLIGASNADHAGIHWTMSCGNDVAEGSLPKPAVPEPATLGLLGLGGLVAAVARKKSSKK